MGKISGVNGKVLYGSVTVANMVSWSMSGFSLPVTAAPTAFGDTGTKVYEVAELGEAGTIEFNGNYDPADTAGQGALSACSQIGAKLTNLYLYVNTNTYWTVGAGGYFIVTKADAVALPRNKFGTFSVSAQVSTKAMTQSGSGT